MPDFSALRCEHFANDLLDNYLVQVFVNKKPVSLQLWAVVGEGNAMTFLFRGDMKARFTIGTVYEKIPAIKTLIDEKLAVAIAESSPSIEFVG